MPPSVPGVRHDVLAFANPSVSASPGATESAQDGGNPTNITWSSDPACFLREGKFITLYWATTTVFGAWIVLSRVRRSFYQFYSKTISFQMYLIFHWNIPLTMLNTFQAPKQFFHQNNSSTWVIFARNIKKIAIKILNLFGQIFFVYIVSGQMESHAREMCCNFVYKIRI